MGVGLGFGLVTLCWMSLVTRKHAHADVTIQIAITIVMSYACFYVAEAVLEVREIGRGGLPLAYRWPAVGLLMACRWPPDSDSDAERRSPSARARSQVSGVLAVVCMGVFLAATFWPIVCSRETMEHVWHTLEWLFNTVRP